MIDGIKETLYVPLDESRYPFSASNTFQRCVTSSTRPETMRLCFKLRFQYHFQYNPHRLLDNFITWRADSKGPHFPIRLRDVYSSRRFGEVGLIQQFVRRSLEPLSGDAIQRLRVTTRHHVPALIFYSFVCIPQRPGITRYFESICTFALLGVAALYFR